MWIYWHFTVDWNKRLNWLHLYYFYLYFNAVLLNTQIDFLRLLKTTTINNKRRGFLRSNHNNISQQILGNVQINRFGDLLRIGLKCEDCLNNYLKKCKNIKNINEHLLKFPSANARNKPKTYNAQRIVFLWIHKVKNEIWFFLFYLIGEIIVD